MKRPHPDQMRPYEWLYWHLVDSGDTKAAEGVKHLLADYRGVIDDLKWERARRGAIRREALEEAAKVCEAQEDDVGSPARYCADKIRALIDSPSEPAG